MGANRCILRIAVAPLGPADLFDGFAERGSTTECASLLQEHAN
jgi:hypothetical protein